MASLNKRAARIGIIALEIAGVLIAVSAGLAGLLFWRLQSGPVSLVLFRGSAEFAVERALPAKHQVTIGKATLAHGEGRAEYDLILDKVVISGPTGERIADLPQVVASFSLPALARGAAGPTRVVVTEPVFRIARDAQGRLSLAAAARGDAEGELIGKLTERRRARRAFRSAEFVRAKIYFVDIASGRTWRADGGEVRIDSTPQGYAARVDAVFDIEGRPASLNLDASFVEETGAVSADMRVIDAPIGDLLSLFYGPDAALLAAPLTGHFSIGVARSGEVISSRLNGRAGEGILKIGKTSLDVAFIDVAAAFDPSENQFNIERAVFDIGGSKGSIGGSVEIQFAEETMSPASLGFDLDATDIVINAPGFFPEPLPIEKVGAIGEYDISERRLSLSVLSAELLGAVLEGAISFARPTAGAALSPEIKAELIVTGALDGDRLLRAWPLGKGEGAREFLETRMPAGLANNLALSMNLPAGALVPDQPMPDDSMSLTFDIVNATAIYTIGMTPVSNAYGSARLTGNRFVVEGIRGRVGNVALSDADVEFTSLYPEGDPIHYRFTANGAARDMLAILDEKPLELLKETKLDPAKFIGDAVARADIWHPNVRDAPRESFGYSGKANFKDIVVSEFYANADVTKAAGEVQIASRSMTVTAKAEFAEAPIDFIWKQNFYPEDGPSDFRLSGVVNSSTGDVFGVPSRKYLRGPVTFDARATGELGAIETISVDADFSEAALMLDSFGWMKPQGSPAKGALDLRLGPEGIDVRSLEIKGDGVNVAGVAKFGPDGSLASASLPRFYLEGAANFILTATRAESGPLELAMTGSFLNAGPFFESILEGGSETSERKPIEWGDGVIVRSRIDELVLRAGARYRDAALDFRHGPEKLDALDLSARTADGAPISMALADTGAESGPAQTIEARTDDIGSFMAGVFGIASVRGGEGMMQIELNPPIDGEPQGVTGLLEARRMRVVGAPLLARIFSAGSLTGLTDLLGGEGIELSAASAEFGFNKGIFTVKEARASGPSVGITAAGSIARGGHGGVDLNGAIAPLYQVNSILGRAPLIGDLFVSRDGEGIVALAYHVTGEVDAPTVAVNPLSALAPGFLRRMFDPVREAPEEESASSEPPAAN